MDPASFLMLLISRLMAGSQAAKAAHAEGRKMTKEEVDAFFVADDASSAKFKADIARAKLEGR